MASAYYAVELASVLLARRSHDDIHQKASCHCRRAHDVLEHLRELAARVEGRHLLRYYHFQQMYVSWHVVGWIIQQNAPMSVSTGPGHCGNATAAT